MKRLAILLVLMILVFLSACAITDISLLQSAKPLGKGRLETMVYGANAMNMYPTQDFHEIYDAIAASDTIDSWFDFDTQENWINWGKEPDTGLGGITLNYGLSGIDELHLRMFLSGSSGFKGGVKHLVASRDSSYLALMPIISYSEVKNSSTSYHNGQPTFIARDKNSLATAEIHAIYTYQPDKIFSLSISPHLALSRLTRKYNGKNYGPYLIPHFGIKAIARLQAYKTFLSGEIGLETAKKWDGSLMVVPCISVGTGVKIGKSVTF